MGRHKSLVSSANRAFTSRRRTRRPARGRRDIGGANDHGPGNGVGPVSTGNRSAVARSCASKARVAVSAKVTEMRPDLSSPRHQEHG